MVLIPQICKSMDPFTPDLIKLYKKHTTMFILFKAMLNKVKLQISNILHERVNEL